MRRYSPSEINTAIRCGQQHHIFHRLGHRAPPAVALEVGKESHRVTLQDDLGAVVEGKPHPGEGYLLDVYLSRLEGNDALRSAPDLDTEHGGFTKLYDHEAKAFNGLLAASHGWRHKAVPVAVEEHVEGMLGGIPIHGYLDLREPSRVTDLKRRGPKSRAYTVEQAGSSLQLLAYAAMTTLPEVAYVELRDGAKAIDFDRKCITVAPVLPAAVARVAQIYAAAVEMIEREIIMPVDKMGGNAWACSARFCGAFAASAVDYLTGERIACPYGELARVSVAIGGVDGMGKETE